MIWRNHNAAQIAINYSAQRKAHKRALTSAAPVPKAKHLLLAVLDPLDELGDVVSGTDTLKHAQNRLIGSSM